jgi:hypothetical protein
LVSQTSSMLGQFVVVGVDIVGASLTRLRFGLARCLRCTSTVSWRHGVERQIVPWTTIASWMCVAASLGWDIRRYCRFAGRLGFSPAMWSTAAMVNFPCGSRAAVRTGRGREAWMMPRARGERVAARFAQRAKPSRSVRSAGFESGRWNLAMRPKNASGQHTAVRLTLPRWWQNQMNFRTFHAKTGWTF